LWSKALMRAAFDLSKIRDREALKLRREPYWQRLRPGCYLGYRPSANGGPGTWIGRAYDEDSQSYRLKALGRFDDEIPLARFALAKTAAEVHAALVSRGGVPNRGIHTVGDACRLFAHENPEAEARFRRYVYSDPLSKIKLSRLRRSHVAEWRGRLAATPALVSRRLTGEPVTRTRSAATLNRDMAVLRTALGAVLPLGLPNTESAWQEALKPIKNAVRRRTLYLNHDERRLLVASIDAEARPFISALCMLPLRPGAVANLLAGDFEKRTSELTIAKDKSGANRRIVVPRAAAQLFASAAEGKQADAPLFTRSNGKPWTKENWNRSLNVAAEKANLPPNITAYTLRHSTITDLVTAGLPLLTVAQISGTSVEMIEKHYGHLIRHAAVKALARLVVWR
jgi:integrase